MSHRWHKLRFEKSKIYSNSALQLKEKSAKLNWRTQMFHSCPFAGTSTPREAHPTYKPESIEWFTESQAFLHSCDLVPPPPPSPAAVISTHGIEDWERETGEGRGGGRRWARSQIIQPRESLVLYKSFNTLCYKLYKTAVCMVPSAPPPL